MIVTQLAFAVGELLLVRIELAAEHRRLKRIFLDAPIAIALLDPEGLWESANPALCRMLGYRERELIGRPFTDFTHPEDLEENIARWAKIAGGHETHDEYEKRYIARDGSEIWAQVNISQVKQWGEGEGYLVAHIQDVTERKRAELALAEEQQLLRAFLQTTPDQMSTTKLPLRDATGMIVGTFGVTVDITARKQAEAAVLDR